MGNTKPFQNNSSFIKSIKMLLQKKNLRNLLSYVIALQKREKNLKMKNFLQQFFFVVVVFSTQHALNTNTFLLRKINSVKQQRPRQRHSILIATLIKKAQLKYYHPSDHK